jgi:hypothetical protein
MEGEFVIEGEIREKADEIVQNIRNQAGKNADGCGE